MLRAHLSPIEFVRLENWCAVPDGKHKNGGVQDRRRKWKQQLDQRRGHLTLKERRDPVPQDERYIDLDDTDVEMIRGMRAKPAKGSWQRDMQAIFGGISLD